MRFAVLAVVACLSTTALAQERPATSAQHRPSTPTSRTDDAIPDCDQSRLTLHFETKGVEFGPWVRRFVAQVRRNWNVPVAAMHSKGCVVVTFVVHKDGAITDIKVAGPSPVEEFNRAAYGAVITSNPTYPLPPEYPEEKVSFTVTFYYNERVPREVQDAPPAPDAPHVPASLQLPPPPATWPPAGAYRLDAEGVMPPRVRYREQPHYPAAAIRERIEGTVLLEGIVQFDGSVASVRVIRSLDSKFGLDLEAIKTATRWRFTPGRHGGEVVSVIVPIEITFKLPK